MPEATPTVAGLMLNYNGRDVTLESLPSLLAVDYEPFELVVVDNGSTDDSVQAIRATYPKLRQLRVRENRGISWGLNHGIQWALDHDFDYLLLMNNDIEVATDFLTEMVRCAESDAKVGCVGPKSFYYSDRERLWSTGGLLRFGHSITHERGDGEIDQGQYDQDAEVPYINGCAMLVRAEAMRAAGFWDPNYYLGVEDADFCTRVRAAGYTCRYAHRAHLWHMISHSLGVYTPGRTFHTGRSSAIYLRKHATAVQRMRSLAAFALAMPLAFVRELVKGNQRAVLEKIRGFRSGFRLPLEPIPDEYYDLVPDADET